MASISLGLGLALAGGLGAAGSIASGVMGSDAAQTAADQQAQEAQNALDFQKQVYADQQQNVAPYLTAGTQSLQSLMDAIKSGKFGPGSLDSTLGGLPGAPPSAPAPFTGTFTAPTLQEAQATPGYQFTQTEGEKGILKGAAAAGGAISGGTLKALGQYDTGLADSTYNDVFNRSLATFGTGLQTYNTNLSDYQAQLNQYAESLGKYQVQQGTAQSAQQQEFGQLLAPIQIGAGQTASINNTGSTAAVNVGNLMTSIGNSQAAGTVGSANAISGGTSSATNSLTQSLLFNMLFGKTPSYSLGGPGTNLGAAVNAGSGP